jgi:hypothetical protein
LLDLDFFSIDYQAMADAPYLDSASKALGATIYGSDASAKTQVEEWIEKIKSKTTPVSDLKVS